MKRIAILVVLLCSVFALRVSGQTITPGRTMSANQPATDLVEANAITWNLTVDKLAAVPVNGKACVGPIVTGALGGWPCTAPVPALTPGPHVLFLTATLSGQTSGPSNSINITMVIIQAPNGFQIVLRAEDFLPRL